MKEVVMHGWERRLKRDRKPWPNRNWGTVDHPTRIISIDPRRNRFLRRMLDTIVHEEIHAVFSEYDERETLAWTNEMVENLSSDQITKLLDLYGIELGNKINGRQIVKPIRLLVEPSM